MQAGADFRCFKLREEAWTERRETNRESETRTTETKRPSKPQETDIAKMIADGIAAGIKPFADKLAKMEENEAQAQRNSQISAVAKKYGIPEFMLKDRNIPENTDLDTYFKDMKQDMSNNGFQFSKAPETAEQKQEKEASEFAKMIEADTKSIVEQQTSNLCQQDLSTTWSLNRPSRNAMMFLPE